MPQMHGSCISNEHRVGPPPPACLRPVQHLTAAPVMSTTAAAWVITKDLLLQVVPLSGPVVPEQDTVEMIAAQLRACMARFAEERAKLVDAALYAQLAAAQDRADAAEAANAALQTKYAEQALRIAELEKQLQLSSSVQQTAYPGAALAPSLLQEPCNVAACQSRLAP